MKKFILVLAMTVVCLASTAMAQSGIIEFNRTLYAAQQGNPDAMFEVGKVFFTGDNHGFNMAKDYDKAYNWLHRVASAYPGRYPEAEFLTGRCFEWGAGAPQNFDNAAYWYQTALNHGYGEAAEALRHLSHLGHGGNSGGGIGSGVTWDGNNGGNDIPTIPNIGDGAGYAGGLPGLVNNTGPAEPPFHHDPNLDRLMRAAQDGRADAQYQLGMAYLNGEHGLPHDDSTAFHWIHNAAEQNYGRAERQLSEMYMRGIGVRHSRGEAVMWDHRARRQGF